MADAKLTALTELAAATTDDLLYIVDDPAGTPTGKKITVGNLLTADFVTETAQTGLPNEVVLGTTVVTQTAYGSRQASAKAGRLHFPTDGFVLGRDDGSAWDEYGPIHQFTPPVSGDFAWINPGTATVSTTNGGIFLSAPANAAISLRIRKKTAPAAPYTITAAFIPLMHGAAAHNAGLLFRQSSNGRLHTLHVDEANNLRVTRWTNETTYSSDDVSQGFATIRRAPYFMQIADDNTNRLFSVSNDGQNWLQIYSVARTTFLTADEVGFFADSENASYAAGILLLSWLQA